jgi:hypothetical protein
MSFQRVRILQQGAKEPSQFVISCFDLHRDRLRAGLERQHDSNPPLLALFDALHHI